MATVDAGKTIEAVAGELLPGWKIRATAIPREQMEKVSPGALAFVPLDSVLPERQLASIYFVTPFPAGESFIETVWHELGHVALENVLGAIPPEMRQHPAQVRAEEQLVERLGNLLARVPIAARRGLARALQNAPVMVRARISARATVRARGGQMDPKMIMEALEALIAGDAEKCQEILKGLIASAAGGEAPHAEPDGDEVEVSADGAAPPAAKVEEQPQPEGAEGGMGARMVARKGAATVKDDEATVRARKAAQDAADDIAAMQKAMAPAAKEQLVVGLRARLGDAFTPAMEQDIMKAPTFVEAQKVAGYAERYSGPVRARSGSEPNSTPALERGSPKAIDPAALLAEGHSASVVNTYGAFWKVDQRQAAAFLDQARTALRARKAV